jgi:hypothetical protein
MARVEKTVFLLEPILRTLSFGASVVKIYTATSSIARFWNKNYFSSGVKTPIAYNAGVVAVNSKVVGLALGYATKMVAASGSEPSWLS